MSRKNRLVAAGLTALMGNDVLTLKKDKHSKELTAEQLFKYTYIYIPDIFNYDMRDIQDAEHGITIKIMTFEGRYFTFEKLKRETKIRQIVILFLRAMGWPKSTPVDFLYMDTILRYDNTLEECNIYDDTVIFATKRLSGGGYSTSYHLPDKFLDPQYDYDFTKTNDSGQHFIRGGKQYTRPIGSERFALKVLDKYSENKWLGCNGDDCEWPVAYHGTHESNLLSIVKNGFDLSKCKRFAYGRGIYFTPDPETAKQYALQFTFEGEDFKLILQTRVNPKKMVVVKQASLSLGEYWLLPKGKDVRPYGICIYPA